LVALAITCWALALLGIGATFGAMLRSQSELQVAYDIGDVLLSALGGGNVAGGRRAARGRGHHGNARQLADRPWLAPVPAALTGRLAGCADDR